MTPGAIGSVIPAPPPAPPCAPCESVWDRWTAGLPHVAAYRTARGALEALLRARAPRRVWLPAYICPVVLDAVLAAGAEPRWYAVGPRLRDGADDLRRVEPGDAAVVVAFFGRSPPAEIAALAAARSDVLWIEDRAQALAPEAAPIGGTVLYSPRKLFGVGDGGLLASQHPLSEPEPAVEDAALWAPNLARADDPDATAADRWFPLFQGREAAFTVDAAAMSTRTGDTLRATPVAREAAARRENWRVLAERLAPLALWPEAEVDFAPLAYPILVDDADAAARALAEARIWCARHWAEIPSPADRFPEAHALAARCLSLPLDGRYGPDDMRWMADAVLRLQPRYAGKKVVSRPVESAA